MNGNHGQLDSSSQPDTKGDGLVYQPIGSSGIKCGWTQYCSGNISTPDKCGKCNTPVHRICQLNAESKNGWDQLVTEKLLCPTCHPGAIDAFLQKRFANLGETRSLNIASCCNTLSIERRFSVKRSAGGTPSGITRLK